MTQTNTPTHLWVRAEQRPNEERVGITPDGVKALVQKGFRVTVEDSSSRAIPLQGFLDAGAEAAPEASWPGAPDAAIIFGLKELPDDGSPLTHRHIMFGHAYKGQPSGQTLLRRFAAGGGTLYDIEYLTDESGRRVAAFGYWAGYAGAAVTLKCWAAQQRGAICGPVVTYASSAALLDDLRADLGEGSRPSAIVIGAMGRVGTGAADLCAALNIQTTRWDMAETAHGGPFPEVLDHDLFFNCILARPGTPVFVPADATTADRKLTAIGDIACDPDSAFSPIKVYDRVTDWAMPALRVHDAPPLDVMAIDNLPSLLPVESSQDFATQLLPTLASLDDLSGGVWARAEEDFNTHSAKVRS
ncbi:MAG: saccharopine dehydrogenase [Rhodobacteraceae bacterium]|nr:saccharopine dehydrogenase [Paracoccaceae bacterium]